MTGFKMDSMEHHANHIIPSCDQLQFYMTSGSVYIHIDFLLLFCRLLPPQPLPVIFYTIYLTYTQSSFIFFFFTASFQNFLGFSLILCSTDVTRDFSEHSDFHQLQYYNALKLTKVPVLAKSSGFELLFSLVLCNAEACRTHVPHLSFLILLTTI